MEQMYQMADGTEVPKGAVKYVYTCRRCKKKFITKAVLKNGVCIVCKTGFDFVGQHHPKGAEWYEARNKEKH